MSNAWLVGHDIATAFLLEREDYPDHLERAPEIDPVWQEPETTSEPFAMTLREIAVEFCLTKERVRQIEAGALRKLRHRSRRKMLEDFY